MKPILYSYMEETFNSNGIGILNDAVSCTVTQERNGMYELEMEYPINGIHCDDLTLLYIIVARPDQVALPQPFRIYEISKSMNGNVMVYARHLVYDLMGFPVTPFTANNVVDALEGLIQHVVGAFPFSLETDKTTEASFTVKAPTPIWDLLKGSAGGILDVYGGEYEFDWHTVKLCKQRGADRGVRIRYGKNLMNLKHDASCENWYSGIYPYWMGEDGTVVTCGGLDYPGVYPLERIKVVDFSDEFTEAPSYTELISRGQDYREANKLSEPSVSITVDCIDTNSPLLSNFGELVNYDNDLKIAVCDTVRVYFDRIALDASAEVTKTKYNVLTERYESIEIGTEKQTLPNLFKEAFEAWQHHGR